MLKHFSLLLLMMIFITETSAKVYQWKDEKGKTHYSDKQPNGAQDKQLTIRSLDNISYSSSTIDAGERVIMYSTDWCGYCKRAKRYFENNSIAYVEYDIEKDDAAKQRFDKLGGRGVPLILVGKKRMSGFSEVGFESIYKPG